MRKMITATRTYVDTICRRIIKKSVWSVTNDIIYHISYLRWCSFFDESNPRTESQNFKNWCGIQSTFFLVERCKSKIVVRKLKHFCENSLPKYLTATQIFRLNNVAYEIWVKCGPGKFKNKYFISTARLSNMPPVYFTTGV